MLQNTGFPHFARSKAIASVVIVLFVVGMMLPGMVASIVWDLFRRVALILGFIATCTLGFGAFCVARNQVEKIIENSRKWEALTPQQREGGGTGDKTVRLIDTVSGVANITADFPDLTQLPVNTLFSTYEIPYEIAKEMGAMIGLIIRDFVHSWYGMITKDPQCAQYIQYLLVHAIGELSVKVRKVNVAVFLCDDVCEALRQHLHWYSEMVSRAQRQRPGAFRPETGNASTAATIQRKMLQQRLVLWQYMQTTVLHPAVDVKNCPLHGESPYENESQGYDAEAATATEVSYLRKLAEQLVPVLLPERERSSAIGPMFLRELLSNVVLLPTMQLFEPYTLNSWMKMLMEETAATVDLSDIAGAGTTATSSSKTTAGAKGSGSQDVSPQTAPITTVTDVLRNTLGLEELDSTGVSPIDDDDEGGEVDGVEEKKVGDSTGALNSSVVESFSDGDNDDVEDDDRVDATKATDNESTAVRTPIIPTMTKSATSTRRSGVGTFSDKESDGGGSGSDDDVGVGDGDANPPGSSTVEGVGIGSLRRRDVSASVRKQLEFSSSASHVSSSTVPHGDSGVNDVVTGWPLDVVLCHQDFDWGVVDTVNVLDSPVVSTVDRFIVHTAITDDEAAAMLCDCPVKSFMMRRRCVDTQASPELAVSFVTESEVNPSENVIIHTTVTQVSDGSLQLLNGPPQSTLAGCLRQWKDKLAFAYVSSTDRPPYLQALYADAKLSNGSSEGAGEVTTTNTIPVVECEQPGPEDNMEEPVQTSDEVIADSDDDFNPDTFVFPDGPETGETVCNIVLTANVKPIARRDAHMDTFSDSSSQSSSRSGSVTPGLDDISNDVKQANQDASSIMTSSEDAAFTNKPTAPHVSVSSLLSGVKMDLDTGPSPRPRVTDSVVALLQQDEEGIMRRRLGKSAVGAPLTTIPESSSGDSTELPTSNVNQPKPIHISRRSEGAVPSFTLNHSRSTSFSGTLPPRVSKLNSQQQSPLASSFKPQPLITAVPKEKAYQFLGSPLIVGGFAGGGLPPSNVLPDSSPFALPQCVSRRLVSVGTTLHCRLQARDVSDQRLRQLLRPPQDPLYAQVLGYVTPNADATDQPVLYEISVESANSGGSVTTGKSWKVYCRYSEFHALHELLKHECPTFQGVLPPKRHFGREDAKFLDTRRIALARWMEEVMQNRFTRSSYEVTTFLQPRAKGAQVGVNIQSILSTMVSAPIDMVVAPSKKLISKLTGSDSPEMKADSSGNSVLSGDDDRMMDNDSVNDVSIPTSVSKKKRGMQQNLMSSFKDHARSATAGLIAAIVPKPPTKPPTQPSSLTLTKSGSETMLTPSATPHSVGSENSDISSTATDNPFSQVKAQASGVAVSLGKCDAFAGVSGRAGGDKVKAPVFKPLALMTKEEQEIAQSRISVLIHEVFGVRSKAWWQRHMITMMENIVKVFFKGVAARTLRDKYLEMTSPKYMGECLHMIIDVMWPDGKFMEPVPPPTLEQQFSMQDESFELLAGMFDAVKTVVDSRAGCEKLHGFFQYPALVKSLAYTLIDLLLARAFPGIDVHSSQNRA